MLKSLHELILGGNTLSLVSDTKGKIFLHVLYNEGQKLALLHNFVGSHFSVYLVPMNCKMQKSVKKIISRNYLYTAKALLLHAKVKTTMLFEKLSYSALTSQ